MYTRFDNWRDYWELLLLLPDYGLTNMWIAFLQVS